MTYDIICLLLVGLAFAGGFQKGVIRIFSFVIAIILSIVLTVWSTPYILDFLEASISTLPPYSNTVILGLLFLILCLFLSSMVNVLWKPVQKKKQSPLQNIAGGLILSAIMILSIAVLGGFLERTKIINSGTKETSVAYKILTPIHDSSRRLWINLTSNASHRANESESMKSET
ncbi:MAG: CvpA family protein [Saprospiraceae bacterium]|nr:CvpA family protein [Saprospiraceae bacterium]